MNIPPVKIYFSPKDKKVIEERIEDVLMTGQVTMGKYVREFEKKFAEYIGVEYAIGVNTGFSALEICLRGLDIKHSSVIVPTNTSMATPFSVLHAGGRVIFTDILKDDLGMDPEDLKRKIRKDTKAVIPVHIGGMISLGFEEIQEICQHHGLTLIEDDAHAHGATIKNKKAGSLGSAGAFSFYATKVITSGEGGMITTNDKKLYERALVIRNYGRPDPSVNIHTEFGANFRLSELHAIMGLAQLEKIDWILAERRGLAKLYDKKLEDFEQIEILRPPTKTESAYYKYMLYLKGGVRRERIKDRLERDFNLVLPAEVYASTCHSQPFYQKHPETIGNKKGDKFPNAEFFCNQHICLPLYPGLREEEVDYVVNSLERVISKENSQ